MEKKIPIGFRVHRSWFNPRTKVIVYIIPRNGHRMVKWVCNPTLGFRYSERGGGEYNELSEYHSLKLINNPDYTSLVILRNPLERYISSYVHCLSCSRKIEADKLSDNELIKSFIVDTENIKKQDVNLGGVNEHYLSQFYYLSKAFLQDDIVPIDYYFSLENIENDYSEFQAITKTTLKLVKGNPNRYPEKQDLLIKYVMSNKELLDTINKIYEKDWKLYNSKIENVD